MPGTSPTTPEQAAAERAAAAERLRLVDEQTSQWVYALTPGAFRSRLRTLIDRLDPRPAPARHAAALTERRVVVDDAGDGMAWLMVLMDRIDAIGAHRQLTSHAKHLQHTDPTETRTRDQIRADLATAALQGRPTDRPLTHGNRPLTAGDGAVTAGGTGTSGVRAKVFVTIPIAVLTGTGTDETGRCTLCGGSGYPEQARIVGGDTIDPATARQLFLDTPVFHRVITDPVRSVILDLERHARHATRAQRDWLALQHGTCSRDGCTRLAQDADIDHITPWSHGGHTNIKKLRPMCSRDHPTRHRTRIRYRTRPDGTTQITTPTGHTSTPPPPF